MADIRGEMVEFQSNGTLGMGYLVRGPATEQSQPGVIVIQEWWGLNDNIKEVADRFAAAGFVALAPDLYRGEKTEEPDEARKLAMALDMGRAVKDMIGAVNYLCGVPGVGRIGAVGFCMGGTLSLWLASMTPRVGAAVSFYGGRTLNADTVAKIGGGVLAFYGGQDEGIPPETIAEQRAAFEQAGISHEIVIYEQAGHAFFNDTRPDHFDPQAAADSWERTLAFFRHQLQTS